MSNVEPSWDETVAVWVTIGEDLKAANLDALNLLEALLKNVKNVRVHAQRVKKGADFLGKVAVPLGIGLQFIPSVGGAAKVIPTILINILAGVGVVGPLIYEDLKSDGFVVELESLLSRQKAMLLELGSFWGISIGDELEWHPDGIPVRGGPSSDVKRNVAARIALNLREQIEKLLKKLWDGIRGAFQKDKADEEDSSFCKKLLESLTDMCDGCREYTASLDVLLKEFEACFDQGVAPNRPSPSYPEHGTFLRVDEIDVQVNAEALEEFKISDSAEDRSEDIARARCAGKLLRLCCDQMQNEEKTTAIEDDRLGGKAAEAALVDFCQEFNLAPPKFTTVPNVTTVIVTGCVDF